MTRVRSAVTYRVGKQWRRPVTALFIARGKWFTWSQFDMWRRLSRRTRTVCGLVTLFGGEPRYAPDTELDDGSRAKRLAELPRRRRLVCRPLLPQARRCTPGDNDWRADEGNQSCCDAVVQPRITPSVPESTTPVSGRRSRSIRRVVAHEDACGDTSSGHGSSRKCGGIPQHSVRRPAGIEQGLRLAYRSPISRAMRSARQCRRSAIRSRPTAINASSRSPSASASARRSAAVSAWWQQLTTLTPPRPVRAASPGRWRGRRRTPTGNAVCVRPTLESEGAVMPWVRVPRRPAGCRPVTWTPLAESRRLCE